MTARDRIMLAVIATAAVIAAAWMLAIKPQREEASTLAETVTQAQTRRDTALATLANAKEARVKVGDAKVGIVRLGKAVPPDEDTATILYQLDLAAKKAKIDFRKLSLDAAGTTDPTPTSGPGTGTPEGQGLTKIPVKLTFDGNFKDLRRFIGALNSLTSLRDGKYVSVRGRLFTTEGVSLQAGPTGFPGLTAQITAVAYSATAPSTTATSAGTGGTTAPATGDTTTASTTSSTGVAAE